MMLSPQQIIQEIDRLSHSEREEVFDLLITRYERGEEGSGSEAAWREVVKERLAEYRAGRAEMIPAEEVYKELDDLLGR